MFNKKQARVRRSTKTRMKIRDGSLSRLSVQRTPKHIYAQITSPKVIEHLYQHQHLKHQSDQARQAIRVRQVKLGS